MIKGTQAWIDYLDQVELPVLSSTMRHIVQLTSSERASRTSLSNAIMTDPDLTTNVLKLSNTVSYNPSSQIITSINRAITVIGFESVKSMALTAMLVEKLAIHQQKEQLYRCLCKAVHAAHQSRWITSEEPTSVQEAVFVASLLHNIGETAFWASEHPLSNQLHDEISENESLQATRLSAEEQRAFLGTTFDAISKGLVKSWRLSPLIDEALSTPKSKAARMARCAIAIANNTEKGWPDGAMEASARMVSLLINLDEHKVADQIQRCRQSTIPLVEKLAIHHGREYLSQQYGAHFQPLTPDAEYQLRMLQKLMQLPIESELNVSCDIVLEGLHKGAGFERVALFLGRTGSHQFQRYHDKGDLLDAWKNRETWSLAEQAHYQRVLSQSSPVRIQGETGQNFKQALAAPYIGSVEALVVRLPLSNKLTGILYADRVGRAPITPKHEASFQLFYQQLLMLRQLHLRIPNPILADAS